MVETFLAAVLTIGLLATVGLLLAIGVLVFAGRLDFAPGFALGMLNGLGALVLGLALTTVRRS